MKIITRFNIAALLTFLYSSVAFAGTAVTPVPEPSITALIGLGVAMVYFISKGRKK
ncbi:PEP-CTERM sorting domain-containing protein [Paraglaciecola sp. MB-3u-78]|uniref:PEP-CTERM sorting domain-containing protein n=1 Tax=Paraglaciecola sp. MB-3u-78 TaxID=2058332 RepID=UPI000C32D5D1|nr:PEP-CTERM sorting domain-containing protein [Paraglaciecola sp. MB-3u-78]PKG96079.1 hypothetical protein CXF95_24285 [Paraglaciecola sp. MB-3u-78]